MPEFVAKKDYNAPMHTAEHILNATMVRMFNCARSKNAHIEKNKSKCDYFLNSAPAQEQILEIERKVNAVILQSLPVSIKIMPRAEVERVADISKLPDTAAGDLRVVFVGDYDVCPCIGAHVENTSEILPFKISSWDYENGRLRIRFKLGE